MSNSFKEWILNEINHISKGWYSPNYIYYPVQGEHNDAANKILNNPNNVTPINIGNFDYKNRRLRPLDGEAEGFEELSLLMKRGWLRIASGGNFIQVAQWDQKTQNLVDQFLSEFRIRNTVHIDIGPDPTKILKSIKYSL